MSYKILGILSHSSAIKELLNAVEKELKERFSMTLQLKAMELDTDRLIDAVAQLVSNELQITMVSILSKNRTTEVVDARFIIVSLCLQYIPDIKIVELAAYFNQHHTSVLHAEQKAKDLLQVGDDSFTKKYEQCKQSLINKIKTYEKE